MGLDLVSSQTGEFRPDIKTGTSDLVMIYSAESPLRYPRRFLGEMFRDLTASRELSWRLAVRDIKAMYRQSMLGYFWAIAPPVASTLTFLLLRNGHVFKTGDTGMPYPLYVLVGTVLWQIFVDAITNPLKAVTANRTMVTKINFPRESLVVGGLLVTLFNTAVRLLILVPLLIYYQSGGNVGIFLFPIGLVAIIALGTCLGLLLTPVGLLYKDVERGLTMVLGLWVFLTPVLFPIATEGLAAQLMHLNPVTPVVVTTRQWFVSQPATDISSFLLVFFSSIVTLCVGWVLYRVALPHVTARLGM